MSEETTQVKISMPLIDNIELQRIDTFYNDIVSEYTKAFVKEKEQVIIQRVMMNLQQENQQLKSTIGALEIALKERTEERDKHSLKEHLCKEVIEEVREYIDKNTELEHDGDEYGYTESVNIKPQNIVFINGLLQILDKIKEGE